MARVPLALAALAGTATAKHGDTHYGAHPDLAEAPDMVRPHSITARVPRPLPLVVHSACTRRRPLLCRPRP